MKKAVCIMFGGRSEEYEVSLSSAYSVLESIDKDKYEIVKIGINKQGEFLLFNGCNEDVLNDRWELKSSAIDISPFSPTNKILSKIHTVFPVVHGTFCEDGRLQSLFEALNVKYVGSDSHSSFLCMDKHLCKLVAKELGIKTAKFLCVSKNQPLPLKKLQKISYPVFVKPSLSGSSRGASRVMEARELIPAINEAFKYSHKVLIEEFLTATECEIGVLQEKSSTVLSSVGALSHNGAFYSYEEKYINNRTSYQIPASISNESKNKIEKWSKSLFSAFNCRGLARIDFFVTPDNQVFFNEINTLPGFTKNSMYPMLFKNQGYSLTRLIDTLIENA